MASMKDKLNALSEISKLQLFNILDRISGNKDVILHENVLKYLNSVINIHDLKLHDVDKIFKLDLNNLNVSIRNSIGVIITYDDLSHIKSLCHQITTEISKNENIKYHLFIVPEVTTAIEYLIEEEGLYDLVELHSYLWQPILIDNNILSLNFPNVFSNIFLQKNLPVISSITKSLQHFFAIFGQPKICFINGEISNDIYSNINQECFLQSSCTDVDYFIMFDRNIDYTSVLMSPTTYEGFLDNTFGSNKDVIVLPNESIINKMKDSVYKEIKYKNLKDSSQYLKDKCKFIQTEQKRLNNFVSLNDLKTYLNDDLKYILNLKKQVEANITAGEIIINDYGEYYSEVTEIENDIINTRNKKESLDFINKMICSKQLKSNMILQLLCLFCIHNEGIASDKYKEIKTNYLNTFGYEYLIYFFNLELLNLCYVKSSRNKKDTIQILTQMLNNEYQSIINKLKSPSVESILSTISSHDCYIKKILELIIVHKYNLDSLCKMVPSICKYYVRTGAVVTENITEKLNIVIYVVGGITSNEIACLNLLEMNSNVNIIISTTNIISGNNLIQQCSKL